MYLYTKVGCPRRLPLGPPHPATPHTHLHIYLYLSLSLSTPTRYMVMNMPKT